MLKTQLPPMRSEWVVCPYEECGANERIGIHSRQERRYKCHSCGRTFAETVGTPLYGLKYPTWIIVLVLSLLAGGCPLPAIVYAFGLDERTVAQWQQKAGQHAQQVHHSLIAQGSLALGQVQGDELQLRAQGRTLWVASAISVFSRLFLGVAVAPQRDKALVSAVVAQVRAAALPTAPLLWAVDGFRAWRSAIERTFRDPVRTGRRGRPTLRRWATLHLVLFVKGSWQASKRTFKRLLVHGAPSAVDELIAGSQLLAGCINTAYIERFNATLRGWLPACTRRSRTPARSLRQLEAALFWVGTVYNFCRIHASLNGSPAMAAGLADHLWSVEELLRFRPLRL